MNSPTATPEQNIIKVEQFMDGSASQVALMKLDPPIEIFARREQGSTGAYEFICKVMAMGGPIHFITVSEQGNITEQTPNFPQQPFPHWSSTIIKNLHLAMKYGPEMRWMFDQIDKLDFGLRDFQRPESQD